jgi:hypothetical protein
MGDVLNTRRLCTSLVEVLDVCAECADMNLEINTSPTDTGIRAAHREARINAELAPRGQAGAPTKGRSTRSIVCDNANIASASEPRRERSAVGYGA